jgi:acetoin utilization protein AcuB
MKKRMPTVKSVMTPFPHAVSLDAPLSAAREFLTEHHIRHLPVVDNGRLVGIVTDRDIKLLLGPDFDYPPESELSVRDAYVEDAYIVDLNTPLDGVLATMAERRLGSAVVTRKGQLAGVLTATDVCRAFARFLRETYPADGDGGPGEAA